MRLLSFEHPNPNPDIAFFSIIGVIIVICVILYLLVPVFKRKQFAESRANLAKREATFRENLKRLHEEKGEEEQVVAENETIVKTEEPKKAKKKNKKNGD